MNKLEPQPSISGSDLNDNLRQNVKFYLQNLFSRIMPMIPEQSFEEDLTHYSIRVIELHDSDSEIDRCERQFIPDNPAQIEKIKARQQIGYQESCLEKNIKQSVENSIRDGRSDDTNSINYEVRIIEVHDSDSDTEYFQMQQATNPNHIRSEEVQEAQIFPEENINSVHVQQGSIEERTSHEETIYQINVIQVSDRDSQADQEQLGWNIPLPVQKIVEKIEQQCGEQVNNQGQEESILIEDKQKDEKQQKIKSNINSHDNQLSNIVKFKRSHKTFKSQLTRRPKFSDQNSEGIPNCSRNRHALDSSRSMALPNFKPKSGYNQLKDKWLVQYFYPRHKKLLNNQIQQTTQLPKQHQYQPKKIFNKCKSEKKYNFTKFFNRSCQKGYNTIQQCGRKSQFTDYDLISCQSSLSHLKTYQNLFCQTAEPQHFEFDATRFSQTTVLRHRIANLQSRVSQKVPYLIKMGVNFRKINCKVLKP